MSALLPQALSNMNRLRIKAGESTGVLKNENKQNSDDGEDEVVKMKSF